MINLIRILNKIVSENIGATFLKSGNLLDKLKDLGEDATIELSDSYYSRVAKEKEVYEKGYLLGRLNRTKKPVYRIEYPPNIYYFIGTEAEILRKITKYQAEHAKSKGLKDSENSKETEEKEEKEKKEALDIEVSEKELSKFF